MSEPDIERIIAPNPGPMTLEGTNTYLVGRDPTVVIDPGPADEGHIEAVRAAADERGGIGTVLLTHGHGDHSDGVELLDVTPTEIADGESHDGIGALATPGHAADHVCFLLAPGHPAAPKATGTICFSGDLILGEGSTIVPPAAQGGSLADYMGSLRRLAGAGPRADLSRARSGGHGPGREDRRVHRAPREPRAAAAGGARARRALARGAAGRRSGMTSRPSFGRRRRTRCRRTWRSSPRRDRCRTTSRSSWAADCP